MWTVGLSAAGRGGQQTADGAEVEGEANKKESNRDIMLVIAGGEGYIDFRRGIVLLFSTLSEHFQCSFDIE